MRAWLCRRFCPPRGLRTASVLLSAGVAFVVLTVPVRAVRAAGACDELGTLERRYDDGEFEETRRGAENCLQASPSPARRIRSLRLKALALIAIDTPESHDEAGEAIAELIILSPDFQARDEDPWMFKTLVERTRERFQAETVTSVSKVEENRWETPATVSVISALDIERRGYTDLVAALSDLPGFDISRGSGISYANLYIRGLRTDSTDRILFLVDGVEQNEIHTNVAYISRQYPMSSIERIEVIYGPASTIYGANAYAGVINVITKSAQTLLPSGAASTSIVGIGYGSNETCLGEGLVATRFGQGGAALTVTGRAYHSREHDLSDHEEWDYAEVDGVSYSDRTRAYYVRGRLEFEGSSAGIEFWSREEGLTGWFTDQNYPGADEGAVWTPRAVAAFARSRRRLSAGWSTSLFSRYRAHDLARPSSVFSACPVDDVCATPYRETQLRRYSSQFISEASIAYVPSQHLAGVVGAEYRSNNVQGDYFKRTILDGGGDNRSTASSRQYMRHDLGALVQVTAHPLTGASRGHLKLVGGVRLDKTIGPGGYDGELNPKLAVISTFEAVTAKLIYAEAFMPPSNWQRYSTTGSRVLPGPLKSEKIRNVETSLTWHDGPEHAQLAVYRTQYNNSITQQPCSDPNAADGCVQFRNASDPIAVYGLEFESRLEYAVRSVSIRPRGRYSYAHPREQGENIARHKVGLATDVEPLAGLVLDARADFLSERDTVNPADPTVDLPPVAARLLLGATLSYSLAFSATENSSLRARLVANNLLGTRYDDPRVRASSSVAAAHPQPGRTVMLYLEGRL